MPPHLRQGAPEGDGASSDLDPDIVEREVQEVFRPGEGVVAPRSLTRGARNRLKHQDAAARRLHLADLPTNSAALLAYEVVDFRKARFNEPGKLAEY